MCTYNACLSHWCEVTRPSCLQTGHQTGQWTLGSNIRHDSSDSLRRHTHPYTHGEIWAIDRTWQQRLLLSLMPDPILPDVPSPFAPPCPSLSSRTNVIEDWLFGQAVSHFPLIRETHAQTQTCYSHTQSLNSHQAFRCRCKWTCGHRGRLRGADGSMCGDHQSPAHHVFDSTDLSAQLTALCVCVWIRCSDQELILSTEKQVSSRQVHFLFLKMNLLSFALLLMFLYICVCVSVFVCLFVCSHSCCLCSLMIVAHC